MNQLQDTTTTLGQADEADAENVRTMATEENPQREDAESIASPSSGKHRAAGKPAKPVKAPKLSRSRAGKAPRTGPPSVIDLDKATGERDDLEPDSGVAGRRPRLKALALPLVAVLTVGFFVAALVMHLTNTSPAQRAPLNATTKAALDKANHDVKDILSYDYRKIDSDINTAKAEITGQLLTEYGSTAAKVLKQAASIKAIVTATVSAQAVESVSDDRVTLLMYIDQESVKQLAGQKTPSTRIDPLRVRMTMNKVDGEWKASNLEPV